MSKGITFYIQDQQSVSVGDYVWGMCHYSGPFQVLVCTNKFHILCEKKRALVVKDNIQKQFISPFKILDICFSILIHRGINFGREWPTIRFCYKGIVC